jgi:DNA-binding NarL/FixJ family response regulator
VTLTSDTPVEWCNCNSRLSWHNKDVATCIQPKRIVLNEQHRVMLLYLAEGCTVEAAAKKADIKASTASYHMQCILTALGAKNIANALAIAFRRDIIW